MTTTINITTQADMKTYAERLATDLVPGTVVGLVGDLGVGKTTLMQYLAEAMGVKRAVRSPTFILLQEHVTGDAAIRRGIRRLWHADAYRIENERELWSAGLAEAIADKDTVTVVEWADKIPALKAIPGYKEIAISYGEGNARSITEN